jgi:hypothetical protein
MTRAKCYFALSYFALSYFALSYFALSAEDGIQSDRCP